MEISIFGFEPPSLPKMEKWNNNIFHFAFQWGFCSLLVSKIENQKKNFHLFFLTPSLNRFCYTSYISSNNKLMKSYLPINGNFPGLQQNFWNFFFTKFYKNLNFTHFENFNSELKNINSTKKKCPFQFWFEKFQLWFEKFQFWFEKFPFLKDIIMQNWS